jgi:hypothetical protein
MTASIDASVEGLAEIARCQLIFVVACQWQTRENAWHDVKVCEQIACSWTFIHYCGIMPTGDADEVERMGQAERDFVQDRMAMDQAGQVPGAI